MDISPTVDDASTLGALGIALFDVAAWCAHRSCHEVPFLWPFHAIHHSAERLDWISGVRHPRRQSQWS